MASRLAVLGALVAVLGVTGCSEYHGAAEESAPSEAPSAAVPEPAVEPPPEPSPTQETSTEPPDPAVNDPDATPADQVGGALASGGVAPLASGPPRAAGIGGTAYLAQTADGTTVTLRLTGLRPATDYVAHLHQQACSEDAGGEHFAFDPGGSAAPPNEVRLELVSDDEGNGEVTVTNDRRVGTGAASVVLHTASSEKRLACADFL